MRRKLTWALVLCLTVLVAAALASVAMAQEPGPPVFHVGMDFDGIGGDGWPANVPVTVAADDPVTFESPDIVLSFTTDAEGVFNGYQVFPGLEPGWYFTVTDGVTTKTHTTTDVSITDVNPATDIVRGTADPFSTVWCRPGGPHDPTGKFVEPDPFGEWRVDFSGDYDITPGTMVNVLDIDPDWDSTFVGWQVPRPEGWQHNPATSHDYLFYGGEGMPWAEAEAFAISLGGHLVTINDAAENDWLIATFGTEYFIGLNDMAVEGAWVWASGEPVTFTRWLPGEPNDYLGEDFAMIWNKPPIGWNDVPGSSNQLVVEVGPTTLNELLADLVADGRLPNSGVAASIMNQAQKAPLKALTNHLKDLVRRSVITQQTMDQILAMVAG